MSTEPDEAGRSFYKGTGDAYRVSVTYADDLPPVSYDASGHDVYLAAHGLLHDIIREPGERVIKTFTVERAAAAAGVAVKDVQTVHIRGLAMHAARLGPGVTIPETVPVLLSFTSGGIIGTARLRSDKEGIHADATLPLEGTFGDFALRADPHRLWPKLSLAISGTGDPEAEVITQGTITALSIVAGQGSDLPDWEYVYDD